MTLQFIYYFFESVGILDKSFNAKNTVQKFFFSLYNNKKLTNMKINYDMMEIFKIVLLKFLADVY